MGTEAVTSEGVGSESTALSAKGASISVVEFSVNMVSGINDAADEEVCY
jgi:hypothetical protein